MNANHTLINGRTAGFIPSFGIPVCTCRIVSGLQTADSNYFVWHLSLLMYNMDVCVHESRELISILYAFSQ